MGVGNHSEGGHKFVERGESVLDIERRTRDEISKAITYRNAGMHVANPTIHRGHAAMFVSTSDGTFVVGVERVSAAVMQKVEGG